MIPTGSAGDGFSARSVERAGPACLRVSADFDIFTGMKTIALPFSYQWYEDASGLPEADRDLLAAARGATAAAYAPYSGFRVGAALRLSGGRIVTGANQENASFPAGLCAERAALAAAASLFPGTAPESLAVSFDGGPGSDHPISPCGICRQSLAEWEARFGTSIRLVLGGLTGNVWVVGSAASLLPLSFSGKDLSR